MINAPQLLLDLKRRLTTLEADLLERISEVPSLYAALQAEWQTARDANRTAETFESWVDQVITQAGVHWLLSCVFLRFIEDNGLVERPWIGGTPDSGRLNLARDRHEAYFRAHPSESDREYLLACFMEAGTLPGLHTFFDAAHNPVFRLGISGDAAMGLRQFWQQQDPNTGALVHDFTDSAWNTRFLGDLYQDLSEATRKRYALLQTPEFVEEFILDRTLTPALREFGYRETRMIDPTCGSGHFLLGGFQRMVEQWLQAEPTRNRRDIAQKALDAVCGVDLNPFAVAISRFRLLLAALHVSDMIRLSEAPDFHVSVAIGDSLLHGTRFGLRETGDMFQRAEDFVDTGLSHAYASEDLSEVQRILGRQYHAVVGNPPYIVVKDSALNAAYRARYASCHMKYSLGAPFTERFFELTVTGRDGCGAGFVGLITANSFMKREFGSKLIEQVLPRFDLTHVIDTSVAYIPGHGTPTVILFGRHRAPVSEVVRTIMGIKGEPTTPIDAARGLVWSAILAQIDHSGSESEFISSADTDRNVFAKHPWSINGGGAADLKDLIEGGRNTLGQLDASIGFSCITGEDEVFVLPLNLLDRFNFSSNSFGTGDEVRNWRHVGKNCVAFPYYKDGSKYLPAKTEPGSWLHRHFWSYRTKLRNRLMFGKTPEMAGMEWWEISFLSSARLTASSVISFAFVATYNHFVLNREGTVFNRSAPVINLPMSSNEDDYFGLLGLLNTSTACFWLQQVCHNKGGPGGGSSKDEKWHDFYEFTGTKLAEFPLVENLPVKIAKHLDALATECTTNTPEFVIKSNSENIQGIAHELSLAQSKSSTIMRKMVALQEELDWHSYALYGITVNDLTHPSPPEINLGERAFEIDMARRCANAKSSTTWFKWLDINPITDLPHDWPDDYRSVVKSRIALIESNPQLALIESAACKRRWETDSWGLEQNNALREWLLGRLELPQYWSAINDRHAELTSTSRLAEAARMDADFMIVAELYAGHADYDLYQLIEELVVAESAPFLPVLRYSETGMRKRFQWEETWRQQRLEDAGEALEKIAVPPKFQTKDFRKSDVWRLRGGLDVPKERWISYPGCERGADGSLVIAWAGWDYLQQATALAGYYLDMKDNEGWAPERLQLLLAGLLDLLPWLEQWHNEVDPVYGARMGDYYRGFVEEEARTLGFTLADLRNWEPPKATAKRGRKAKA